MDKIHSWDIGGSKKEQCSQCGMDTGKGGGCCRDEIKVVKLAQDVLPNTAVIPHFALPALVIFISNHLVLPFQNSTAFEKYSSDGPPLLHNEEIYITNCIFRL